MLCKSGHCEPPSPRREAAMLHPDLSGLRLWPELQEQIIARSEQSFGRSCCS